MMRNGFMVLFFLGLLFFSSCSAVRINTHAVGSKPPLCRGDIPNQKTLVLWGAAWRSDQKEKDRREQVASEVIRRFFHNASCCFSATVEKSIAGREAITMSDSEILKSDMVISGGFQKVVVLRLEELGPLLMIYLSPILWEGLTNVSLRIRILDVATSSLESDITIDWKKGGAFNIRGSKYFDESLTAALDSIFGKGT
jgi:hypothetical protein